jgi:predicted O-methyltransferase YrrM
MFPQSESVLRDYARRIEEEARMIRGFDSAAYLRQREEMLLGIGPESGQFLNQFIKAVRPKTIVEVGTAFGYSTLWMADAAKNAGAVVYTLEIVPSKQTYAAAMLEQAGLTEYVRFVAGDATVTLGELDAVVDFVLIDLWKNLYIPAFDAVLPKLAPEAVVIADNMLFPDYQVEAAAEYQAHIRSIPGVESVTIPIGSGLEFSLVKGNRHLAVGQERN